MRNLFFVAKTAGLSFHFSEETIRVLAIDPSSRGFGFVVFEGSERLIDWGVRTEASQDLYERRLPDEYL